MSGKQSHFNSIGNSGPVLHFHRGHNTDIYVLLIQYQQAINDTYFNDLVVCSETASRDITETENNGQQN